MESLNKYRYAYHVLRVGMAVTFIWIGVLILRSPVAWSGMVQPWVAELVPVQEMMIGVAFLDIAIGILLLINVFVWFASVVASLHLASVLISVGIDVITVRDIGLMAATLALAIISWPTKFIPESWRSGSGEIN